MSFVVFGESLKNSITKLNVTNKLNDMEDTLASPVAGDTEFKSNSKKLWAIQLMYSRRI